METEVIDKPKQKRGRKGAGTVFQRNGVWIGEISVGYDGNGKRIRRRVSGKTKEDVTNQLTRLAGQKLDGTLTGGTKFTVSEWLNYWIKNIAPNDPKKPCRATTLIGYEKMIRLYINPSVGGKPLSKLTKLHVRLMHGTMRQKGCGNGTIRIAHSILSRSIEMAIENDLLMLNPCRKAGRPGEVKKEMPSLTPAQAGLFIQHAKEDRLHALYVLALTGGMRQGELFGLKRPDIDLEAGTVVIRRTLVHSKSKGQKGVFVENPPKSANGNRTVDLSEIALDALRDHFRRMMIEGNAGSEYVFCTTDGSPLWRSNVRRKSLAPILTNAGLPQMRFHDLRHSSASLQLSWGINPKVIAQQLGHDVETLMKTYAHALPGAGKEAAGKWDRNISTGTAG